MPTLDDFFSFGTCPLSCLIFHGLRVPSYCRAANCHATRLAKQTIQATNATKTEPNQTNNKLQAAHFSGVHVPLHSVDVHGPSLAPFMGSFGTASTSVGRCTWEVACFWGSKGGWQPKQSEKPGSGMPDWGRLRIIFTILPVTQSEASNRVYIL